MIQLKQINKLIILLIIFMALGSFVVAQEEQKIDQMQLLSIEDEFITKSNFIQFQQDSIWQLSMISLSYLACCVTIILIIGGIFYIININPLKERIEKIEDNLKKEFKEMVNDQEKKNEEINNQTSLEIESTRQSLLEDIEYLRIKTEKDSEELNKKTEDTINDALKDSKNKIKVLESEIGKKLEDLDKKYKLLEFLIDWDRHYVWETSGIYINAFNSLMSCLEKAIAAKYNIWFTLILDEINITLDKIDKKQYNNRKEEFSKLMDLLNNIDGLEEKKKTIIDKAKNIFN